MSIRQLITTNGRPRLLITGASTRAAAWSAVRAGFFPVCADRFADADLRKVAEVHDFDDIQSQIREGMPYIVTFARIAVSDIAFLPWVFWETPQQERENLRLLGPLLGRRELTRARGVMRIAHYLLKAGLPSLREQPGIPRFKRSRERRLDSEHQSGPPKDGSWLRKPWTGGGGNLVQVWDAQASSTLPDSLTYFQEFRAGQPMSAIFLVDRNRSPMVELIGLTEQLIGEEVAAAPSRFAYCGNIAPVTLPAEATHTLQRIGEVLAEKLGQRGIFGVDFIWDGTTPWVVEVNPRYTASCELLELVLGRALLRDHWQAWLPNEPLPPLPEEPRTKTGVIGKLILYARTAVTAPDLSRFLKPRSPWTVPFLADIPRQGTAFSPGDPMCTVFATAATPDVCRKKLQRRAERVRRWFGDLVAPGGVIS